MLAQVQYRSRIRFTHETSTSEGSVGKLSLSQLPGSSLLFPLSSFAARGTVLSISSGFESVEEPADFALYRCPFWLMSSHSRPKASPVAKRVIPTTVTPAIATREIAEGAWLLKAVVPISQSRTTFVLISCISSHIPQSIPDPLSSLMHPHQVLTKGTKHQVFQPSSVQIMPKRRRVT